MTDLYIIAAGKGSRMGPSDLPKALVPITNEPNLTTTLKQIGHKFSTVFVVTNTEIAGVWDTYYAHLAHNTPELAKNVKDLSITSGRGDGHAVLQAMAKAEELGHEMSPNVVICWGDVFVPHAEIVDEMLSFQLGMYDGIVPTAFEENPYVALRPQSAWDGDGIMPCQCADFSKWGETNDVGYHDQSFFRFNIGPLRWALIRLDQATNKNGKYITPGGELSLLHVFHYMANTQRPAAIYQTKFPTLSFNTPEEVASIQNEINKTWTKNHAS